jgi:hypothetical protein
MNDLKGMSEAFAKYPDQMEGWDLFLTREEGGRR